MGCGAWWGVVGAHARMGWCRGSLVRWSRSEGWEDDWSGGGLVPWSKLSWWARCHLWGTMLETLRLHNIVEGSGAVLRPQWCRGQLVIKGN